MPPDPAHAGTPSRDFGPTLRNIRSVASEAISAHWLSALLVAAAVVTYLEQRRLIRNLTARYVNEDHTLLWMAAGDWARLDVREPTFYGQSYGVTLEAIPVAILNKLGVPIHYALPIALAGMAVLAWWLLAWAALRRGHKLAAFCAMGGPILVNLDHWVVVEVIGTGVGRFMAAATAALVFGWPSSRRNVAIAVALGGSAMVADTACALLAIPALVWGGIGWLRDKRVWLPACLAASVPISWYELRAWFFRVHPDHNFHQIPGFDPSFDAWLLNWNNPDWLFKIQSLELLQHGILVPIAVVTALALALSVRAWRAALTVASLIAMMIALAAMPKSLDSQPSLWFPAARMSLTTPMAVWFAFAVTMPAVIERARQLLPQWKYGSMLRVASYVTVIGLITASALHVKLTWRERIEPIREEGLSQHFMVLYTPQYMRSLCRAAAREAKLLGTAIVAFPRDRAASYACAALYPELITVHPPYERRTWILEKLAAEETDRMIVWNIKAKDCDRTRARRALASCTRVADDRALSLVFKRPRSALAMLRALGHRPRPFGPGCNPQDRPTCPDWLRTYTNTPVPRS